ncbi:MAG: ribosome biogenesis GTP-binding protein YihA/YsxC [Bacteroidia bacterium]|nr:ribosome biogenesis GTP-binding protein YihA/YsxC [Bacteroidia bacterium]MCX7651768.1 ribosome biogenesis GTP-binding protein YihA/YsxC [Bacteroidia bacterium]MDW8416360.1 ribosome biogenesis GTP-binding protein YihA/YsxC [Bacteroidia bacterium]
MPNKPVVALSGRSNVGKSSLLNRLLGYNTAPVSQRPGCTHAVRLYELPNEALLWADMPGYGYAAVARVERYSWRREVLRFIEEVRPLVCVLIDSRLPPQRLDKEWIEVLRARDIRYILVANKADKLNQSMRYHQRRRLFSAFEGALWQTFVSAHTQEGVQLLRAWVNDYFTSQQTL